MKNKILISLIAFFIVFIGSFSGCINEEVDNVQIEKTNTQISIYFMENLTKKNYQKAYSFFDQILKDSLSLIQLENTWESILNIYGEFQDIVETRKTNTSDYEIVYLNCSFKDEYLLVFRFVFENKTISGFWIDNIVPVIDYNPPSYIDEQNFSEINITIGVGDWQLPATLTIPNKEGPFPGVVLVHGSGPNDRDETIGRNKPFKDIAWGLASQDIVVLRYEKRTKIFSEEISKLINLTVKEEVIDDALLAVEILSNSENVDKENIFIIGHSLGGMLAPRIVQENKNISGIVILAGPTRKIEDLLLNQTEYLVNIDGIIDESESEQIEYIENQVQKIKELNISENEIILGAYKKYWEDLNQYDQVETANNISISILILQGGRDYQVTQDDFDIWNKSIGSKDNVKLIFYPDLNHLFMFGVGMSVPDEYLVENHVDLLVINDILKWIKNQ